MTATEQNDPRHSAAIDTKLRVGVLVSHPIQYLAPVFRTLAQGPGLDVTVIYRTQAGASSYRDPGFGVEVKWDVPLTGGYKSLFLSKNARLGGFQPRILTTVLGKRFDVLVVHGYSSATHLVAIALGRAVGTKILLRGDTRLQKRHVTQSRLGGLLKRLLFRLADGCVAIGTQNARYYREFGVKPDRLYFAPLCVENEAFSLAPESRDVLRAEWRGNLGIPTDAVVMLFVGKLVEQKRPLDLLRAMDRLSKSGIEAWLIFAGSGQQQPLLEQQSRERELRRVVFLGFVNQGALPGVYAAADLVVLPAEAEAWGLTVNEGMAAGLPVVVSDVGAASDLVDSKDTGFVYECGDIESLAEVLHLLVTDPALRRRQGATSARVIERWSVAACASSLAEAARAVASIGDAAGTHA